MSRRSGHTAGQTDYWLCDIQQPSSSSLVWLSPASLLAMPTVSETLSPMGDDYVYGTPDATVTLIVAITLHSFDIW